MMKKLGLTGEDPDKHLEAVEVGGHYPMFFPDFGAFTTPVSWESLFKPLIPGPGDIAALFYPLG